MKNKLVASIGALNKPEIEVGSYCNQCKINQCGPCGRELGIYYNCGQKGHLARDCRKVLNTFNNKVVQSVVSNKPSIGQGKGSGKANQGSDSTRAQARNVI